jgi:CBS domain-containing protein
MKVSEVMTTGIETVRPDQQARDAARFMLQADAGSIPVTDGERLVGMITDRDIAVRGVALGYGPDTLVSELMSTGVISAHADEQVEDVARKMGEAQVRRLPVIDDEERLVGIVSLGDLARQTDEQTAGHALEGVSAPGSQHQQ